MKISSLFLAGAALISVVPAAFAANAKVCFEAEKYVAVESPLKKVGESGTSGGGVIEIPWDKNKTKGIGSATYKFNAKTAGIYYVWARSFWANGCGNSVSVAVNGKAPTVLGEDGTYDAWHWVGGGRAKVQLKAGVNTLVLSNRETGVKVDQFFMCQDKDYTPTGIRPITK